MHTWERTPIPAETFGHHHARPTLQASVQPVVDESVGDMRELQAEVRQLRQALDTRAPIEQAKGVLMLRYRVDAEVAFRILVRWSSVSNVKLRVIAQALVELTGQGSKASDCDPVALEMVREAIGAFDSVEGAP